MTNIDDVINQKINNAGAEALAKGDEMSDELKLCPFCGKSELHVEKSIDVIYCKTCGAEMDTERGDWNTRPIEDALRAQLASRDALIERLMEAGEAMENSVQVECDEDFAATQTWKALVTEYQASKDGGGE